MIPGLGRRRCCHAVAVARRRLGLHELERFEEVLSLSRYLSARAEPQRDREMPHEAMFATSLREWFL